MVARKKGPKELVQIAERQVRALLRDMTTDEREKALNREAVALAALKAAGDAYERAEERSSKGVVEAIRRANESLTAIAEIEEGFVEEFFANVDEGVMRDGTPRAEALRATLESHSVTYALESFLDAAAATAT